MRRMGGYFHAFHLWVEHLQRGNDQLAGLLNRGQVLSHPFALGIGYVVAHLLASVRLTPGCVLWTLDQRLAAAATRLGVAAGLLH